jgi:hypothetical protein
VIAHGRFDVGLLQRRAHRLAVRRPVREQLPGHVAGNVITYSGDAANAMLRDPSAAAVVVNASREQLESSPQFRNGVRTGKLFVNLADAECDVGSGTYCEWRVNNLDVYYQWETGPNQYNQFARSRIRMASS